MDNSTNKEFLLAALRETPECILTSPLAINPQEKRENTLKNKIEPDI